jgi:hypothetical protein
MNGAADGAADGAAGGQAALFDEVVERHTGRGEFRGMEFLHVNAQRIINELPTNTPLPFRYTINAYRGCSHACTYCLEGDTPVLMADGRTKPIAELEVGNAVYGTERQGRYRRFVTTRVLDHWSTVKPAYRVTLIDGTELVASADHRFLSTRGWKHVVGAEHGRLRRPHLTLNSELLGTGAFAVSDSTMPSTAAAISAAWSVVTRISARTRIRAQVEPVATSTGFGLRWLTSKP